MAVEVKNLSGTMKESMDLDSQIQALAQKKQHFFYYIIEVKTENSTNIVHLKLYTLMRIEFGEPC